MQTQFTVIDNLNIRYAEHEQGFEETLLLLNPVPESIFCFTPIWNSLARQFNLLAIDMPGFGQSEAREDLYSVSAMADFLPKLIDHFAIKKVHILGPDIGAPIALFLAARYPERIKSIIINGGAAVIPFKVDNVLRDIMYAPDLEGFKQLAVKDVINGSLSELRNYRLPDEIRADYISSYENGRLFTAMKILRAYIVDIPILNELLESIMTPVQIIWGVNDPVALVDNAYILHERLPKNKIHIVEDGAHYIWEENSAEYLAIITNWLSEGYKFLPVLS
jgi:pimeloyl-ACP methyl ester carboxylesterase